MKTKCQRPRLKLGNISKVGWFYIIISLIFGSAKEMITKGMTLLPFSDDGWKFNHPYI